MWKYSPVGISDLGRRRPLCALLAASALFVTASTASADEPPAQTPLPAIAVETQGDSSKKPLASWGAPAEPPPTPTSSSPGAPLPSVAPRAISAPEPVAPPPAHSSNTMRIAGIVITGVAIAGSIAGTGLAISAATCSGELCGVVPGVLGYFIVLPASALLSAVGVPLWVVGTVPPKAPTPASASRWVPQTVAVGPGTARLQWSF